jgi:hypothetical protein
MLQNPSLPIKKLSIGFMQRQEFIGRRVSKRDKKLQRKSVNVEMSHHPDLYLFQEDQGSMNVDWRSMRIVIKRLSKLRTQNESHLSQRCGRKLLTEGIVSLMLVMTKVPEVGSP